jgi:hypothetical protein
VTTQTGLLKKSFFVRVLKGRGFNPRRKSIEITGGFSRQAHVKVWPAALRLEPATRSISSNSV